jgi:hypothetical protein
MAGETEGGHPGAWTAASALSGTTAGQRATGGSLLGWTPVGRGMWAGAGACALHNEKTKCGKSGLQLFPLFDWCSYSLWPIDGM